MAQPPAQPKIYHIVHVDRLASIVADGFLSCDAAMAKRANAGTTIGMMHHQRTTSNFGDQVSFWASCWRMRPVLLLPSLGHVVSD
jgi:ssDNA thymidine ADP-ribosyltransferase, DarT